MSLSRRKFVQLMLGGTAGCGIAFGGGAGLGALYWLTQRSGSPSTEADLSALATTAAQRFDGLKEIERPYIVPRDDWGALDPDHSARFENGFYSADNPEGWYVYPPDIRDAYKTLVIHHSVIDEGDDLSTLIEIQRAHRKDRNWADVAYHFFIGEEGTVYEGRALDVRGTHVAGYNTGSAGVCLLGNYMELEPNEAQLRALGSLSAWLALRLQLTHLAGHRDFNSITLCPGDNIAAILSALAERLGLSYGTEGYQGPIQEAAEGESSLGCGCHL